MIIKISNADGPKNIRLFSVDCPVIDREEKRKIEPVNSINTDNISLIPVSSVLDNCNLLGWDVCQSLYYNYSEEWEKIVGSKGEGCKEVLFMGTEFTAFRTSFVSGSFGTTFFREHDYYVPKITNRDGGWKIDYQIVGSKVIWVKDGSGAIISEKEKLRGRCKCYLRGELVVASLIKRISSG